MKLPGRMLRQVLRTLLKKPATTKYPFRKVKVREMPENFRGKIVFHPEKCIGCKLCMRDCPSGAIVITKVGDKSSPCTQGLGKDFKAQIDLGKCVYCGQCVDSCLKKALEITGEFELAQLDREKLKITFDVKTEEAPPEEA